MRQAIYRLMVRWRPGRPQDLPDQFEETLIRAATPAECWTIICSAAPTLGFSRIHLELGGQVFEWKSPRQPSGAWELTYDISPVDRIRLTKHTLTPVAPFVETLRRTLAPKLPIFRATSRQN